MEKIPQENLGASEPAEKEQSKELSLSEQIEAKESQLKNFQSYIEGLLEGAYPADHTHITKLINEIEALKRKKIEILSEINDEYEQLFTAIRAQKKIEGSVREFSPEEIIKIIKDVRRLNISLSRKIKDIFSLEKITRSNGLREKVEELIKRERSL